MSSDKFVFMTGCSSGIGLHAALDLHHNGPWKVIASARKPEDVQMLKDQGLESVELDLVDECSVQNGFARALEVSSGKLYGLFNNGAYGQPGALEDISREVLKEQFETNVFGTHQLTNLALKVMRKTGEGRIVQNSSILGFIGLPFRGSYNASKYALEGLSDTLRQELRGTGIYVSLIEPGPILTKFRMNSLAAFERNISIKDSPFADVYNLMLKRLKKEGPTSKFTLPPEAVTKRLRHALSARYPNPRYYVTFPTYLLGFAKRFLSAKQLDAFIDRISKSE